MQWVGLPKLVAGVFNAGRLGLLPSDLNISSAIKETRILTSKPFGVNITLLPNINPPDYADYARAAVEEGVTIFETAGNRPGKLIKYFKPNGCVVIHKCTTIRHPQSAVKLGIDVLSIDGFECAGHPGEQDIGGLVLLARAVQDLKVPYLVSDGIADAHGVAAALALGVSVRTRFVCIVESPIHENIKKTIVKSSEQDTVHIFCTLHNTARVFKNKHELMSGQRGRLVYETGDVDAEIWSAGIAVGLINDIPTCQDLLCTIEKDV
ncbi:putative 2-Nitropropane dioxygenase [Mycena olivaceomarginata]|nr:putative 2-Nitropropane dioxygenase [Mycena olivaceomarginata]